MKNKKSYFMNIGKNGNYFDFLNDNQIAKLKNSFNEALKKYNLWIILIGSSCLTKYIEENYLIENYLNSLF